MLRMKWTRQRCQAALNTWAIGALRPSCASEITSLTPDRPRCCKPRRKPSQNVAASEGPMPKPRISPAVVVDAHGDYGGDRHHPSALAYLEVEPAPAKAL